jgi:hypothetical protein
VTVDWGTLQVADVLPARVPDLFAARPLVIVGRYAGQASGTVTLRGLRAGRPYERKVRVELPAVEPRNRAVGQLWARTQIGELRLRGWRASDPGSVPDEQREAITRLALRYRLMTEFTSFVAVEERIIVEGGTRRTIQVPVEMPAGVSPEGVFGGHADVAMRAQHAAGAMLSRMAPASREAAASTQPVRSETVAPAMQAPGSEKDIRADQQEMRAKLHVDLLAIVVCLDGGKPASECTAARDGRVRVRLTLAASPSPDVSAVLARLGFALETRAASTTLVGTIAADRLEALASLDAVVGIAPASLR